MASRRRVSQGLVSGSLHGKVTGTWSAAKGWRYCSLSTFDLDEWNTPGKRPDGSEHKFSKVAIGKLPRHVYFGFQDKQRTGPNSSNEPSLTVCAEPKDTRG
jgi:hypothetical protein